MTQAKTLSRKNNQNNAIHPLDNLLNLRYNGTQYHAEVEDLCDFCAIYPKNTPQRRTNLKLRPKQPGHIGKISIISANNRGGVRISRSPCFTHASKGFLTSSSEFLVSSSSFPSPFSSNSPTFSRAIFIQSSIHKSALAKTAGNLTCSNTAP